MSIEAVIRGLADGTGLHYEAEAVRAQNPRNSVNEPRHYSEAVTPNKYLLPMSSQVLQICE
jgi:hypothetical protein